MTENEKSSVSAPGGDGEMSPDEAQPCHGCGEGQFVITDSKTGHTFAEFFGMAVFCTDDCLAEWVDRLHEPVKLANTPSETESPRSTTPEDAE